MKFIYLTAEPTGLENPYGERSRADYSLWGHKQSDTTERLSSSRSSSRAYSLSTVSHTHTHKFLYIKASQISACKTLLMFIISVDPQNKPANENSGVLPFFFL